MQIIFLSASDFYYLPRVKNLEREYNKCEDYLKNLQQEFDQLLDYETCSTHKLNVIADKMQTAKDLMKAINQQVKKLKYEFCN
jgi:DNA repair exonuclease SbcCD ATPase subunit